MLFWNLNYWESFLINLLLGILTNSFMFDFSIWEFLWIFSWYSPYVLFSKIFWLFLSRCEGILIFFSWIYDVIDKLFLSSLVFLFIFSMLFYIWIFEESMLSEYWTAACLWNTIFFCWSFLKDSYYCCSSWLCTEFNYLVVVYV